MRDQSSIGEHIFKHCEHIVLVLYAFGKSKDDVMIMDLFLDVVVSCARVDGVRTLWLVFEI